MALEHQHLYHRLISVSEWFEGEDEIGQAIGLVPEHPASHDDEPPAAQDPDAGWAQRDDDSEEEEDEDLAMADAAQVSLEEAIGPDPPPGDDAMLVAQYSAWLEDYDEEAVDQPFHRDQVLQSMRRVLEPSPEEDEEET